MRAAILHGARDFRLEDIPAPSDPGPGEVLIRIASVGVCGSDLHTYTDGRIGDTVLAEPLVATIFYGGEFTVPEATGTLRTVYRDVVRRFTPCADEL